MLIEHLKYAALRLVTGAKKGTLRELLLNKCHGLCTMQNRRTFHKLLKLFSIINHQGPLLSRELLAQFDGVDLELPDLKCVNFFIAHMNIFSLVFTFCEFMELVTCKYSFIHSFL